MNKFLEVRRKLGYSQSKLAELLGCKQSKISKMERGVRYVSLQDAKKLKLLLEIKGIIFDIFELTKEKAQE